MKKCLFLYNSMSPFSRKKVYGGEPANNVRTVDEALEELRDRRILLSITKEVMRGARNSLSDVKYTLLPTIEFIDEAKKANIRAQQLLKQRGSLLPEKSTSEATAEPV